MECCQLRAARKMETTATDDDDFTADVTAAEIRRRIKDLW